MALLDGPQDTRILLGPSSTAVTPVGGSGPGLALLHLLQKVTQWNIPVTVILAESEDGLLLATVHVYSPAVVTVRVWVYCAVSGSFKTVWVPWVTVVESLVQVTVVAGPPVEIQVRVN